MKRSLRFVPLLALAAAGCVLPGDAAWSGAHVNGFAGGYYTNLGGSIQTRSRAGGGTVRGNFDVDRVGQGDNALSGIAGMRGGFAPFELAVTAFDYSESALGRFNGSYLGQGFSGQVRSDFDVRSIKATLGLDVVNTGLARAGVLVGVDYLDTTLRLEDVSGAARAVIDEQIPVPEAGVRADVALIGSLRLGGEVTGLDIAVDDYDARFFDIQAGLHYSPLASIEAVAGWRYTSMEFSGPLSGNDFIDVDLEFSGPFLGIGLTF